jgi:AraC-like DNA-binding protein
MAYVRTFAQREISASTPDIVQSIPACLESTLELDFANPPLIEYVDGAREPAGATSIVGPQTHRRTWIRLRGPIDSFRVFFRPLALGQLFRVPGGSLVNRDYPAEEILGNEVRLLWQRMAECGCFTERVRLMEEYLLGHAGNAFAQSEIVSSALHIVEFQGTPSVSTLAHHAALSIRQLERRFLLEIGMAPKLFARIVRFQLALDCKLASPARSWLSIAHEFGYHDQMHMIRDFQQLSGTSPGAILLELGDMRPLDCDV